MLPRSQRLSAEQFASVMKDGRVSHSSLFLLRAKSGTADTRVSTTVPTKIAKTAVQRNLFRRKLYEAVRLLVSDIIPHTHIAIIAKPHLFQVSQKDIEIEMKEVFVKAKLLR